MMFIYFYVSVCVVIFDLSFTFIQERSQKNLPKRIETLKYNMELTGLYTTTRIKKQDMESLLRRKEYITAFGELVKEMKDNKEFIRWCGENIELLSKLAIIYNKSPSEYRAYFAYLITSLPIDIHSDATTDKEHDEIKSICNMMVKDMYEQSVYLRENTFKALLKYGTTENILTAIEIINDNLQYQNEKLLTDNLLCFKGKHSELVEGMWESFDSYTTTLQVVLINYMRLLPKSAVNQEIYWDKLIILLKSVDGHMEVKLAIIRYFRKYHCEEIYETLLQMVTEYKGLNWECSAVAAMTLASYPGEKTINILKKAMNSRNWYLRFNASESLISLGEDCYLMLENTQDSYAGEMLEYRLQVHEMKKKGKALV